VSGFALHLTVELRPKSKVLVLSQRNLTGCAAAANMAAF
jgi:hypothetical protein